MAGNHDTDDGNAPVLRGVPHVPTSTSREQVEQMAAFGLTEKQIAYVLKATTAEIRLFYREELEHGAASTNTKVAACVLHTALDETAEPAIRAAQQRFWLQTRARWAPATSVEHKGELSVAVSERQQLIAEITRLVATPAQQKTEGEASSVPASGTSTIQ